MKAAVLHEYGGPSNLKYEDFPDPHPGPGEVRVHVMAVSINPVDWKMRSGAAKDKFPLQFPAILGRDVAGIVESLGEGVTDFKPGDKVFTLALHTYAEFCTVKATDLAKVPDGLDMTDASTVPLGSCTGNQLMRESCYVQPGQIVLVTGAVGSVGRCALLAAQEIGAKVIAGVRKKQMNEALALGAASAIDLDDDDELARLDTLDCIADTVGGKVVPKLLAKLKPGGTYGSLLGPPEDAALHPLARIKPITAHPDAATVAHYGEALRDKKLQLKVARILPLSQAGEGQAEAEKGGKGKIVLVP